MEFSLRDIIKAFKRCIWVILALTIIGMACAGLFTKISIGIRYNSTSKMQWKAGKDVNTCIEYVKNNKLLTATSEAISNKYTLTTDQIKKMISVKKVGSENEFVITVSNSNKNIAYTVSKALVEKLPDVFKKLQDANSNTFGMTVAVVKDASKPSISFIDVDNLGRNALIGGIAGAFIGVVLSFILYFAFKIISERVDVERYFDFDVIGAISEKDKENALKLLGINALDTVFTGDCKKIVVAGVGKEKEYGKFKKFINVLFGKKCDCAFKSGKDLAIAVAELGKKTLYIDCVISKANTTALGVQFENGLSDYLAKDTALEIKQGEVSNLSIICAGNGMEKSTQALYSVKMKEMLDKFSNEFDCIVLDLPSVGVSADAPAMHGIVDGYVLAVKAGANSVYQVNDVVGTLCQLSANVHGIILDDAKSSDVFGGRQLPVKE